MAGVGFKVTLRGLRQFQDQLRSLSRAMGNRAELHRRLGIQALNWVDQNFRQEGALTGAPWRKLRPSTVAGRRKGSSKALQDTGQLRMGFNMRFDNASARVGSPSEIAPHHEFGTKGPYDIYPKRAKALAWRAEGAFSSFLPGGMIGRVSKRLRTTKVKASFSSLATQKTYKKGQHFILAKHVIHPGLPARRMLPRRTDITFMERVRRTTLNYIKELRGKGEQL